VTVLAPVGRIRMPPPVDALPLFEMMVFITSTLVAAVGAARVAVSTSIAAI
jgi:hypothetical protein